MDKNCPLVPSDTFNSSIPTEFAAIFAAVTALSATALAVPVKSPVTSPSIFATRVPVVILRFPVDAPVKLPVPRVNLSALSSKPIKALSESPLSITIPASFAGVPVVPVPSSINRSSIVCL